MKKESLFRTEDGKAYLFTFLLIATLFMLWGFCNGMIDVMDKHFQESLHLTKAQSAWVQFAHYSGYCFMAIPAGWIARRIGYKGGILTGLFIVVAAGLWFVPATQIASFWAFLLGVCVLAMGLTCLETVAHPYTTVLGAQRYAPVRINLAQACNGVGWILGPFVGSMFFYSRSVEESARQIYIPYLGVAIVVFILAIVFVFAKVPDLKSSDLYHMDDHSPGVSRSIWSHGHFVGAVAAQFFYVAAQAGIFAYFVNYMTEELPGMSASMISWLPSDLTVQKEGIYFLTDKGAGWMMSWVAFVLFVLGRFSTAMLLKRAAAHSVLGVYSLVNVVLMALIFLKLGWISVVCVLLSFFFMAPMFPTIFALGIWGMGAQTKSASSFIVMAIFGGALLPKLMGYIADHSDMSRGFIMPLFCFLVIGAYGFAWSKLSNAEGIRGLRTGGGH